MKDSDRERLIKLLGMTGSVHDGEALVAIRKSNELLRSLKLGWADVIDGTVVQMHRTQERPRPRPPMAWREKAMACLMHHGLWSREREFLQSICVSRRYSRLTEKQQKWLDDIHERLFGEAA